MTAGHTASWDTDQAKETNVGGGVLLGPQVEQRGEHWLEQDAKLEKGS